MFIFQIPQAVTFLLDALKTFQSEGWTSLEIQTLKDISHCYRLLGEEDKLIRNSVKLLTFDTELESLEREKIMKEVLDMVDQLGKASS